MKTELINCVRQLPGALPLFSLQGSVLLPRAQLPLHVYEPHYLSMISDAIQANGFIGIVQPSIELEPFQKETTQPLYTAGTAGIINTFQEDASGSFLISITGICRFDIKKELNTLQGYRTAVVSYDRYQSDLAEESDFSIDRVRLFRALRQYFQNLEIDIDWEEISKTSNDKLLTALTMVCPFAPREKQALLETPTPTEQSQLITTLIEMATFESNNFSTCH